MGVTVTSATPTMLILLHNLDDLSCSQAALVAALLLVVRHRHIPLKENRITDHITCVGVLLLQFLSELEGIKFSERIHLLTLPIPPLGGVPQVRMTTEHIHQSNKLMEFTPTNHKTTPISPHTCLLLRIDVLFCDLEELNDKVRIG